MISLVYWLWFFLGGGGSDLWNLWELKLELVPILFVIHRYLGGYRFWVFLLNMSPTGSWLVYLAMAMVSKLGYYVWPLVMFSIPILISFVHWWKNSQVRWRLVSGAMINQDVHGNGEAIAIYLLSRWYIFSVGQYSNVGVFAVAKWWYECYNQPPFYLRNCWTLHPWGLKESKVKMQSLLPYLRLKQHNGILRILLDFFLRWGGGDFVGIRASK